MIILGIGVVLVIGNYVISDLSNGNIDLPWLDKIGFLLIFIGVLFDFFL